MYCVELEEIRWRKKKRCCRPAFIIKTLEICFCNFAASGTKVRIWKINPCSKYLAHYVSLSLRFDLGHLVKENLLNVTCCWSTYQHFCTGHLIRLDLRRLGLVCDFPYEELSVFSRLRKLSLQRNAIEASSYISLYLIYGVYRETWQGVRPPYLCCPRAATGGEKHSLGF